jgi:hypothetical protein
LTGCGTTVTMDSKIHTSMTLNCGTSSVWDQRTWHKWIYMNSNTGVYNVVKSIVDFGVGIVQNMSLRRYFIVTY